MSLSQYGTSVCKLGRGRQTTILGMSWLLSNGVRNRGNDARRGEGLTREREKSEVMRGRRIVPRINGDGERGIELWKTSLLYSLGAHFRMGMLDYKRRIKKLQLMLWPDFILVSCCLVFQHCFPVRLPTNFPWKLWRGSVNAIRAYQPILWLYLTP